MEIVSPDFVLGREVMSKEQTFRSEDNDFLVQNVQPLRSVQPPRRAAPFKTS
jgi:hypothetical protein